MDLPLSRAVVPRLLWQRETSSTNDDVRERVVSADAAEWPNFSTIATLAQHAGRGRLGRSWNAPQGTSLAVSVLARPTVRGQPPPTEKLSWLSLLAGLAMTETVRDSLMWASVDPERATLKWPNDVLIRDSRAHSRDARKISGVLCEIVVPSGGAPAVVIGAGLNIGFNQATAPTPVATSLAIEGMLPEGPPTTETVDRLLSNYLTRLTTLVNRFLGADGDARESGMLDRVSAVCGTIGRRVCVERVADDDVIGTAIGFDNTGRLLVHSVAVPGTLALAAGDVTHLRY